MSRHLHILGICGTFMGGIAVLARSRGHVVTGCDANVYPPMSTQLEACGIRVIEGWDEDQLALKPDLWLIGNVVGRGNPLMEALLDRGEPFVSGPQWLAENILPGRRVLAVAGTHGKTTTAWLLAWILSNAGLRPGYLIGGVPIYSDQIGQNSAEIGTDKDFVIEADEYDTAFFDKRSKFLHYRPGVAILNNLEFDHADIFDDLAAIERQFHHLVRTMPRAGTIVLNATDPALARVLARGCWSQRVTFGNHDGWWTAPPDAGGAVLVHRGEHAIGELRLPLPGEHNRRNALAALAAAAVAGVAPGTALAALATFPGVRRRLELRGEADGVRVYDDFAHHPTAIAASLAALRERIGSARLLAVLEPRSNTMRLGTLRVALAGSLAGADRVFLYEGGLGWRGAEALAPLGARAACHAELDALVAAVAAEARAGDHVLVMSNGAFGGVHARLLQALAR